MRGRKAEQQHWRVAQWVKHKASRCIATGSEAKIITFLGALQGTKTDAEKPTTPLSRLR